MKRIPGNALVDDEAGEVDDAIALGEERRVLMADDFAGANERARIEGRQRAIPLLRAPAGALDRALRPGGRYALGSRDHATDFNQVDPLDG
jgi:hypothetical protein